jgi:hypothetical protein
VRVRGTVSMLGRAPLRLGLHTRNARHLQGPRTGWAPPASSRRVLQQPLTTRCLPRCRVVPWLVLQGGQRARPMSRWHPHQTPLPASPSWTNSTSAADTLSEWCWQRAAVKCMHFVSGHRGSPGYPPGTLRPPRPAAGCVHLPWRRTQLRTTAAPASQKAQAFPRGCGPAAHLCVFLHCTPVPPPLHTVTQAV